jgi:ribosome-associated protein
MDLRKLQRLVVDALEDVKGQDIAVFDSTGITELFDRVVVVSGTSNRQTRALAMHLRDKAKEAGLSQVRIEGEDTGEWVLVDLGDIIVHVMQPAIRQYYNLEDLWGAKKVRVATLAGPRTRTLAAPTEDASLESEAIKPAAKKRASTAKPAVKTVAAKAKPAAKKPRAAASPKPSTARSATTKPKAAAKKPRATKAGASQ